ncbi:MAG: NADH-quinone oxidoreductase subunit NuoK [Chloroflexota bacterium]
MQVTLTHYLVLSALIFSIGLFGALAKRNVVTILMSIELMFNAVNVALIAFSRYLPVPPADAAQLGLNGQVFALFIIAVAAAEAAVALAIILAIYRERRSVNVEDVNLMKW